MAQINIPKELLQKETFKTLPAKEKEEYIRNLLKKILELNPDGVTISQIKEATGLNYSTIWHHLEVLSYTAEAHKISHGNVDVYHHIGKVNHLNDHYHGNVLYTFSRVEKDKEKFISIHVKRQTKAGSHTVCGGLCIPFELVDNLIDVLAKTKESDKVVHVTAEELLKEGLLKKE